MNNKGFTLVELLISLVVLALIFICVLATINQTLTLSNENAYEIIKNNIKNAANNYIIECENNIIDCKNEYSWELNNNIQSTSFVVDILIDKKYLDIQNNTLINPINNMEMNNCLKIEVTKNNITNIYEYKINDNLCNKDA